MNVHRFSLPIALVAVLALPLQARAADPLLSGYAGPGSGEQVVLGGGTVGGDGSGGSGGSGSAGATADQSLRARPAASDAVAGPEITRKPQRQKSSSSASKSKQSVSGSTTSGSSSTTQGAAGDTPAGAPRVVAYPTRDGDVSGLPVSLVEMLLGVLALALLVLAALGLRRFAGDHHDSGPTPQVPVR